MRTGRWIDPRVIGLLALLGLADHVLAQGVPARAGSTSEPVHLPLQGRTLTPGEEVEFRPFTPIAGKPHQIVITQTTRFGVKAWALDVLTLRGRPSASEAPIQSHGFIVPQLPAGSYAVRWNIDGEYGPESTFHIAPRMLAVVDESLTPEGESVVRVKVLGPLERPRLIGTGTVRTPPIGNTGVHQAERAFRPTITVASIAAPSRVRLAEGEAIAKVIGDDGIAVFRFVAESGGCAVTFRADGLPDASATLPERPPSTVLDPGGPEQAPVLYVHGFKDDGAPWGRGSLVMIEDLFAPIGVKYSLHYGMSSRSPATFLAENGIENWAVQWWSLQTGGAPETKHQDGFAFLATAELLRKQSNWVTGDWTPQNYPIPSALDVLLASTWDLDLAASPLAVASLVPFGPEVVKAFVASQLPMRNNYNDSGRTEDKAQDLLEMLRVERSAGGRLAEASQINLIAHSHGSLVTRSMLDRAAGSPGDEAEAIANVIYNAPPFGGSTLAHLDVLVFGTEDLTAELFADPQLDLAFKTSVGTAGEVLRTLVERLLRPFGVGWDALLATFPPGAAAILEPLDAWSLEYDRISDLSRGDLRPVGEAIANAMEFVRPLANHFIGLPGFPCARDDLTPEAGVVHLTEITTNSSVKQFVTLGRGGVGTWLFPADLNAVANRPELIADASAQIAGADDDAVSEGSARLLTVTDRFGPRMSLLGVLDRFNHGDLVYGRVRSQGTSKGIGPLWLEALLAAPTSLVVRGRIVEVDIRARTLSVTPAGAFSFQSKTIERSGVRVEAKSHEYRTVVEGGTPSSWTKLEPNAVVTFAQLADRQPALLGSPFRLEWRSVNARGGREMIRFATMVIQEGASAIGIPSVMRASGNVREQLRALRSELFAGSGDRLVVPVSPSSFHCQWDDGPVFVAQAQAGARNLSIELDRLSEGAHTLHVDGRNAGSQRDLNPRRVIRVTVDRTPPELVLHGARRERSGEVVGPGSILAFETRDAVSGVASASATLPDGRSVRQGELFRVRPTRSTITRDGMIAVPVTVEDVVGNRAVKTFRLTPDWAPPSLEIVALDGAVLQGSRYVATGKEIVLTARSTDATSSVESVGFAVISPVGKMIASGSLRRRLETSELFEGTAHLAGGRNVVVITATDAAGNQRVTPLEVHVQAAQPGR